jgi:hypothetical protein
MTNRNDTTIYGDPITSAGGSTVPFQQPSALSEIPRLSTKVPHANIRIGWRCFHCDEYFTGAQRKEALEHFGIDQTQTPACKIAPDAQGLIAIIREQQLELRRYHEEDTQLHREFYKLGGDHQQAAQRAEEQGYERGLKDGRALVCESA